MARKILFLMENYNEMAHVEVILRRIGFDAIGLQKPHTLSEKLISFSPDIVLMPGRGAKINGVELNKKIKRRRGQPKVIFITNPNQVDVFVDVDAVIETPFNVEKFLDVVGNLLTIDVTSFKEKLHKLNNKEQPNKTYVTGARKDTDSKKARFHAGEVWETAKRGYARFTKGEAIPTDKTLDRNQVQAYVERAKDILVPDEATLDRHRRAFVEALFGLASRKKDSSKKVA